MDNRIRMTENWLMLKNEHEESITEKQEGWREDKNNSRQRIVEKEDSSWMRITGLSYKRVRGRESMPETSLRKKKGREEEDEFRMV